MPDFTAVIEHCTVIFSSSDDSGTIGHPGKKQWNCTLELEPYTQISPNRSMAKICMV
jgi:hypothetical protein